MKMVVEVAAILDLNEVPDNVVISEFTTRIGIGSMEVPGGNEVRGQDSKW